MEVSNGGERLRSRADRKFLMKWTNGERPRERERERDEELADDVENETTVAYDLPMSRMIEYETSFSQLIYVCVLINILINFKS